MAPRPVPGLWDDDKSRGCGRWSTRCTRTAAARVQLLHAGLRGSPLYKTSAVRPRRDLVRPRAEPGAARRVPGAPTPKELEEHEIEEILDAYAAAARRAAAAGVDGVEFHLATATCPGSSSRRSTTSAPTAGAARTRTGCAFPSRRCARMRTAIGDDVFIGYRINSTSFWPGDLEPEDVEKVVAGLEREPRHRLRQRLRGRPPLVHPHADGVRGRLGAGYSARPAGLLEAGAAGRPHHDSGRRRKLLAAGEATRSARAPAVHRPRVGAEGARRAGRRTSAAASPRTTAGAASSRPPRAVRLQPRPSAASGLGRRHARRAPRSSGASWSSARGRPAWSTRASRRRGATSWRSSTARPRPAATCGRCPRCRAATEYGRIGTWLAEQAAGTARRSGSAR